MTPISRQILFSSWISMLALDLVASLTDHSHWRHKLSSHVVNHRRRLSVRPSRFWRRRSGNQKQCFLFTKLPPEIREMIYELVLTETGALHISSATNNQHGYIQLKCFACFKTESAFPGHRPEPPESRNLKKLGAQNAIPLLTTCRAIYTEAVRMLYSRTHFCFYYSKYFAIFSSITPRTHFIKIRRISLDFFALYRTIPLRYPLEPDLEVTLRTLRLMTSLRELNLIWDHPDSGAPNDLCKDALPRSRVKDLQQFVEVMPSKCCLLAFVYINRRYLEITETKKEPYRQLKLGTWPRDQPIVDWSRMTSPDVNEA